MYVNDSSLLIFFYFVVKHLVSPQVMQGRSAIITTLPKYRAQKHYVIFDYREFLRFLRLVRVFPARESNNSVLVHPWRFPGD